jgi:hypothetical protein
VSGLFGLKVGRGCSWSRQTSGIIINYRILANPATQMLDFDRPKSLIKTDYQLKGFKLYREHVSAPRQLTA